jgi:superfamily I DNA/RNA helicase
VDGNSDDRSDTISVFDGPPPSIQSFKTESEEIAGVSEWMSQQLQAGVKPHEIGVFVRSAAQLDRAKFAVKHAGQEFNLRGQASVRRRPVNQHNASGQRIGVPSRSRHGL